MTLNYDKTDTSSATIPVEAREMLPSPIRARAALPGPAEFVATTATSAGARRLRAWLTLRAWQFSLRVRPLLRRGFDLAATSAALIGRSPLSLTTALARRIESPGPILFPQTRVGKRGQHFTMYKFRSMRVTAEAEKAALSDRNESEDRVLFKMKVDPRITRVGRILRRLSIDELPQLLNILRGDMSIVGPRPPVPSEVAQYNAEDRKRLHAKPGLTCLWQISGRSDLSFAQQVRLDIRYLANRSLSYDLKIILKTTPAVLGGKGAY